MVHVRKRRRQRNLQHHVATGNRRRGDGADGRRSTVRQAVSESDIVTAGAASISPPRQSRRSPGELVRAIAGAALTVAVIAAAWWAHVVTILAFALIYLVDQKMTLTGTERRFRIPLADPGKEYTYPIRIEVVRNGQTLVSHSEQKVRGGQQVELAVAESVDDNELVAVAKR